MATCYLGHDAAAAMPTPRSRWPAGARFTGDGMILPMHGTTRRREDGHFMMPFLEAATYQEYSHDYLYFASDSATAYAPFLCRYFHDAMPLMAALRGTERSDGAHYAGDASTLYMGEAGIFYCTSVY